MLISSALAVQRKFYVVKKKIGLQYGKIIIMS